VAVVFWNGGTADPAAAATVSGACSALCVQGYARASVGGLKLGPAFVGVLHNSGLLVPALCTQLPRQVQCPTVSKSQLLARTAGRAAAAADGVPSAGDFPGSPKPKRSWLHACSPHTRGAAWPVRGAHAAAALAETMLYDPQKVLGTAASSGFFYVGEIKVQLVSRQCPGSREDRSIAASTEAPCSECSEHAEDLEEDTSEPLAAGEETMLYDPQKVLGTAAISGFFYVGDIKVQLVSQQCPGSREDRSIAASTEAPCSECSENAEDLEEDTSEPLAAGEAMC